MKTLPENFDAQAAEAAAARDRNELCRLDKMYESHLKQFFVALDLPGPPDRPARVKAVSFAMLQLPEWKIGRAELTLLPTFPAPGLELKGNKFKYELKSSGICLLVRPWKRWIMMYRPQFFEESLSN